MFSKRHRVGTLVALAAMFTSAEVMAQDDVVVVRAGRVITVSGDPIDRGDIVIVDGKIELIGVGLEWPASATVIDARDQVVMPGMIHPWTRYGFPGQRSSGVKGNRSALDEVYLDELDWEALHEAGFTIACIYPDGVGIPGTTSVMRLGGPEDDRVLDREAHLRVLMANPGGDKSAFRNAINKAKAEIAKVDKARQEWDKKQKEAEARRQAEEAKKAEQEKANGEGGGEKKEPTEQAEEKKEAFKPPKMDAAYMPLIDLIQEKDGAAPIVFEVGNASGVLHLEDLMKAYEDLPYTTFLRPRFGGDFNYAVERLGGQGGLIMAVNAMHSLPTSSVRYNLIGELYLAGLEVALVPQNDSANGLQRHRSTLAELVRNGLGRDDAYRSVTLNAAKAIGVDERVGSIEKGKDADLIFFSGDPLAPTSTLERVMILGETVWEKEDDS